MVALDSAIILNPQVWVASGHVGGFSDPLVDCRTCKLRFRADDLEHAHCGKRPSKRPGRGRPVRPHRGARVQPDVRDAHRAGARTRPRPPTFARRRRRASSSTSRTSPRRCASSRRSGSPRSARASATRSRPGNFIFRLREFEQMEMEFFVPAGRGGRMAPLLDRANAAAGTCRSGCASRTCACARTTPTSSRTTRARRATSSTSSRSAGSSSRGSRTAATTTCASTPSTRVRRSNGSATRSATSRT